MESSDLVALVSAFVAALAALYARWSANAAQRTNEIAIHNERLKLYRGVLDLAAHAASRGPRLAEDQVWHFNEVARLSEFYFNEKTYQSLDGAFQKALIVLSKNDQWETRDHLSPQESEKLNSERYAIARDLRDECFEIADKMKEKLKVGNA